MDHLIFIDTNIYLRFYDSNSKEFKNLLKVLIEVKQHLIIPQQIVNEVVRNKARVYIDFVTQGQKRLQFPTYMLAEHLEDESKDVVQLVRNWNKKLKKIKADFEKHSNDLRFVADDVIRNIISNTDPVSKAFESIFSNAEETSLEQYEKAVKRKEIGNPPGKTGDPLGDQINWEQILDSITNAKTLIIISNDSDYADSFNDECYLNPFLTQELKDINPKLKFFCYRSLSEGLKKFKEISNIRVKGLPSKEKLSKIKEEEKSHYVYIDLPGNYSFMNSPGVHLPGTYQQSIFSGSYYHPISGSYQMNTFAPGEVMSVTCSSCGHKYSTAKARISAPVMVTCPKCAHREMLLSFY